MTISLALLAAALVVLPHAINQSRLSSTTGACLWLAVLSLRAVLAISLVLTVVLIVAPTDAFTLLTHWCIHAVIPLLESHLGFDGHRLGGIALTVPVALLVVSSFTALFAAWRGARLVAGWVRRSSLGPGPRSSLLIDGSEVMVACAGVRRPKVVVSLGALVVLDRAELDASLHHEWGHAARRHAVAVVFGQLCLGASRLLPGGRRALAMLRFHLERSADEYAVQATGNPLALASAICKAAGARPVAGLGLAGSGVSERLSILMDERPAVPRRRRPLPALGMALTVTAASLTLTLAVAIPTLGSSGLQEVRAGTATPAPVCA
ncbi:M56 family metallopeptidase [Thermoleophilia bacterium SCSIO 60948]|nr:M56 family metallopeptidase [Thermoleophilia bacterium SCSIO 60948]